jgi:SAM-dependent methyltransferase
MALTTGLQYRVLRLLAPRRPEAAPQPASEAEPATRGRLVATFGTGVVEQVRDKCVLDFGCGCGRECLEMAAAGARRVIGLDIRESVLARARRLAEESGLAGVCRFTRDLSTIGPGSVDVVTSFDAFEHFADPAGALDRMYDLLRPGGLALVTFGPPWYHPKGGHLFSPLPWAHLVFSEEALVRWRSDFKRDGARRFSEVEGGLNRMTIGRFVSLAESSRLSLDVLEAVPIRPLRLLHSRVTREFTTSIVRARLSKPLPAAVPRRA